MSRWSRKTDEEKAETQRRIEANSRPKKDKWQGGMANEIYAKGQIPMMCPKCGWTFSHTYHIKDTKDSLGFDVTRIIAPCILCEKMLFKALPDPFSAEGIIFGAVALKLVGDGSLSDDRSADKNIQSNWHNKRR